MSSDRLSLEAEAESGTRVTVSCGLAKGGPRTLDLPPRVSAWWAAWRAVEAFGLPLRPSDVWYLALVVEGPPARAYAETIRLDPDAVVPNGATLHLCKELVG